MSFKNIIEEPLMRRGLLEELDDTNPRDRNVGILGVFAFKKTLRYTHSLRFFKIIFYKFGSDQVSQFINFKVGS